MYPHCPTHPGKIHSDRLHLTGGETSGPLGVAPSVCCEDTGAGGVRPESEGYVYIFSQLKAKQSPVSHNEIRALNLLFDADAVINYYQLNY